MADIENLQALVARSSAKASYAVLLFAIEDPQAAAGFLRNWIAETPSGFSAESDGRAALHFLFGWPGLEKLLEQSDLDLATGRRAFDVFFADPLQAPDQPALAEQMGFTGASDARTWWDGHFKTRDIEFAIYGAFDTPAQRSDYLERIRADARRRGLRELGVPAFPEQALAGFRPRGGRLHFGYRDGITTPKVDWSGGRAAGMVDMREIITGYPSDDYPTAPFKAGPWQTFSREGSFGCLTWVSQDAVRFETFLDDNAASVAGLAGESDPREWLAAKLLGRWRNGAPLPLHPTEQPADPDLAGDFGFADDPSGLACPITAHIRVVNSRDQPMSFPNRIRFPNGPPRLGRRGFSYGKSLEDGGHPDEDRGLVGLFLCARVNEQFYTVMRWMQKTDFSDVYRAAPDGTRAQDALLGERSSPGSNTTLRLVASGAAPLSIGLATFLRYRGVAVLFAPGMAALRRLAGAA